MGCYFEQTDTFLAMWQETPLANGMLLQPNIFFFFLYLEPLLYKSITSINLIKQPSKHGRAGLK